MKTKDKLVNDLLESDAPVDMVLNARMGFYDDYESPNATPIINLVNDCKKHGLKGIGDKARNGDYDGTKEEADAYLKSEGLYNYVKDLTKDINL